jgi:hypothetical protein
MDSSVVVKVSNFASETLAYSVSQLGGMLQLASPASTANALMHWASCWFGSCDRMDWLAWVKLVTASRLRGSCAEASGADEVAASALSDSCLRSASCRTSSSRDCESSGKCFIMPHLHTLPETAHLNARVTHSCCAKAMCGPEACSADAGLCKVRVNSWCRSSDRTRWELPATHRTTYLEQASAHTRQVPAGNTAGQLGWQRSYLHL